MKGTDAYIYAILTLSVRQLVQSFSNTGLDYNL